MDYFGKKIIKHGPGSILKNLFFGRLLVEYNGPDYFGQKKNSIKAGTGSILKNLFFLSTMHTILRNGLFWKKNSIQPGTGSIFQNLFFRSTTHRI